MNLTSRHTLSLALFLAASGAYGGSVAFNAGGDFNVQVTSFAERRFATVIRQQYDFSCGSAALATLLSHHYERPTTEEEVFKVMYEKGDKESIRKDGFSLLDMKNYLSSHGFQADGYQISLLKLADLGIPAIALTNANGYFHFVVIKGVDAERILIGDPAQGITTLSRAEFEATWNGILFFIRNHVDVARSNFNNEREWQARPLPPYHEGDAQTTLANFTLAIPRPGDF